MPKVRMWKVTHRRGFEDEFTMVSLRAEQEDGKRIISGPVWGLPLPVAQSIFMNDLTFLPEMEEGMEGTEVKLAVAPMM